MNTSDRAICDFILELVEMAPAVKPSPEAIEIAQTMPSEHRQKFIDLTYMIIESTDTPAVWWAYLLELMVKDGDDSKLKRLHELLEQRLETGKWS